MLTPYPLEPPPLLPPLDGPWEGPDAPLLPGRRARVDGPAFLVGEGLGVRALTAPAGAEERRLLAHEDPSFIWEVRSPGAFELSAELVFPGTEAHVERSEDRTRLWLAGPPTRAELIVGVLGGTLDAVDAGQGIRLVCRGNERLRVVVVGATDEADRELTLRALARKGFEGIRAQRSRHAAQLDALALRLRTAEPERDEAVRALAHRLDAELRAGPGGRLSFDDPPATGASLLALGLREPVREALRAPFDGPASIALFAAYAAWAGADDFVRKHWTRAEQAVRAMPGGGALAAWLLPVAEGLGERASVTALAAMSGDESAPSLPIPALVQELWGVVPTALEGAVTLAPALPRGWTEMTLERLRIGPTLLDVRVRRRPAGLAVKCRRTHGPALVVHLRPRLDFVASGVLVHDALVPGPGLTLTVDDEAEGVWLT